MDAMGLTAAIAVVCLLTAALNFAAVMSDRSRYFASSDFHVDQALNVAPPPFPIFGSILVISTSVAVLLTMLVSLWTYS